MTVNVSFAGVLLVDGMFEADEDTVVERLSELVSLEEDSFRSMILHMSVSSIGAIALVG